MTDFTLSHELTQNVQRTVKHTVKQAQTALHASADAIFFVRMFARAY